MRRIIIAILLLASVLILAGCSAKSISEVKTEDMVGKTVTVQGTVESSIKLGAVSGYTVKDDTDSIRVSASTLPKEGTTVTVTGVLMKDTLLGYYIKANE